MIRKIGISENDRKSILNCNYPKDFSLANLDFLGVVVNKPWGYEYLMFQNHEVAIWLLYIKKGYSTSTHCHPNKKTSLLLISGEAISSTLCESFNLKEKEGLILDKGVFHTTEAISENGIFVIEIETPPDKTDLVRLKDNYKRELKGYTSKQNITNKIYNYHYQYIEDKNGETKTLGKYKFFLREYSKKEDLLKDLENIEPDNGILISGCIWFNNETSNPGDLLEIGKLNYSNFDSSIKVLFLHERKNLIKLSDYIVSFLVEKGINQAFLVSGGNLMHILESIRTNKNMKYVCNHHEQASAMAAEGYSKMTGKIGLCMVTSGPGGTNAITGVAGAWIDSNPVLVISGQSYDQQTIGNTGLRQLGVQELNIVDIVKPITKYAVMIKDPKMIRYHLEKALYLATSGRPGPVWVDIPINLQLMMIEKEELICFYPEENHKNNNNELKEQVNNAIESIKNSKRPVIILGNGVRFAHAEKEFLELAKKLSIPIVTTRNANDLIWEEHPLYAGRIGSFGQRSANFTVQNSDLVLSIGSRISLAVTGWAYKDFARDAKKIIVDIDETELKKPTIKPDISIKADAGDFIREMNSQTKEYKANELQEWKEKIRIWKQKYPICLPEYRNNKDLVNTYYFIDVLSKLLKESDSVVTDMGMSFQCVMQGIKLKKGQRLFTSAGLAAMGFGLPGSIGACIGKNNKKIICITGDGGLMMNLQELQTVIHNKLPIKIFLFNNNGYATMRETQMNYFKGYIASEPGSGVSMPDFIKIGQVFGFKVKKIENQDTLEKDIMEILDSPEPYLCDIKVSEKQRVMPKQGFFNRPDGKTIPRPIEDMIPYLSKEELEQNMLIDIIPFDPYKEEL